MADVFSKRKRSAVMSAIRSHGNRDTELRLITIMRAHGITGWRRGASLQWKVENERSKTFRVRPDFVFRTRRLAVFLDGCFSRGSPQHATQPENNAATGGRNRKKTLTPIVATDASVPEPAAFGDFVSKIPGPLGIGKVLLESGQEVPGFIAEPRAVEKAEEITRYGGWRAWLAKEG